MTVERRSVDPRTDALWASLMAGERGSLFGAPPWIAALVDAYGFDIEGAVLVGRGGEPLAGLAAASVRDVRGDRVVSLPFCDRLDPVVDDDDHWDQLIGPVLARGLPVALSVLEAGPFRRDRRFEQTNELAWHVTDLDRPEAEILASLHSMARRNMKKALHSGVTVRFGTDLEDVHTFHRLHRATRKHKYRLLAQPLAFFEAIWKQFAPLGGIVVGLASHEGEVIAGNLYLVWNDVLYYKFAASTPEGLGVRPNDLLAWESLRLGQERGCRRFDWGVSDLDQPGLVSYKQKFATDERRVTVLRHSPEARDDTIGAEAGQVLGELTQLLTRDDVPDEVTQRAGEILYRFFC